MAASDNASTLYENPSPLRRGGVVFCGRRSGADRGGMDVRRGSCAADAVRFRQLLRLTGGACVDVRWAAAVRRCFSTGDCGAGVRCRVPPGFACWYALLRLFGELPGGCGAALVFGDGGAGRRACGCRSCSVVGDVSRAQDAASRQADECLPARRIVERRCRATATGRVRGSRR